MAWLNSVLHTEQVQAEKSATIQQKEVSLKLSIKETIPQIYSWGLEGSLNLPREQIFIYNFLLEFFPPQSRLWFFPYLFDMLWFSKLFYPIPFTDLLISVFSWFK